MNTNPPRFHDWAKQIAVWLAITTLLPFTAYFSVQAFTKMPNPAEFYRKQTRLNEELISAKTDADKDRLRAEIDGMKTDQDQIERVFASRLFYVSYPLGLIAIVVGLFTPVQSVGAGLMFGGLATLTTGCYEGFEFLSPTMKFSGLILLLAVIIVLGLLKYRAPRPIPI